MISFIILLQILTFSLEKKINLQADLFKTDFLSNHYVINKNSIVKYNANFEKILEYTDYSIDKFDYIDLTNPSKIIAYSRNFGKIYIFNDKLIQITPIIELQKMDLLHISNVCFSTKNGIWAFDSKTLSPLLIDFKGIVTIKGYSLLNLNLKLNTDSIIMQEIYDKLYILIPNTGLFIYRIDGNLDSYIQLKNIKNFQILNKENFLLQICNKLFYYNLTEKKFEELILSCEKQITIRSFYSVKNQLFILTPENFLIFKAT